MTAPAGVSVVIPCYNAVRYVAATLRSVLAQDGVTLEVIVVDDGSNDGSADLVERLFPQVRLVRQPNQGVAVARNAGIACATRAWVAFVDADDIWLPGKLQAQLRLLHANPAARMAYTAWQIWESTDPEPPLALLSQLRAAASDPQRWAGASGWIYPELLLDCVVWTSTVLAQRSFLEELGGFDPALRIGEDYDLWLRASQVSPILRVAAPLALYRLHPQSITRRVPDQNYQALVIGNALQRWGLGSPDGRVADRSAVSRGLARTWLDHAAVHLAAGQFASAREHAFRAVRLCPAQPAAWKVLARAITRMPRVA